MSPPKIHLMNPLRNSLGFLKQMIPLTSLALLVLPSDIQAYNACKNESSDHESEADRMSSGKAWMRQKLRQHGKN